MGEDYIVTGSTVRCIYLCQVGGPCGKRGLQLGSRISAPGLTYSDGNGPGRHSRKRRGPSPAPVAERRSTPQVGLAQASCNRWRSRQGSQRVGDRPKTASSRGRSKTARWVVYHTVNKRTCKGTASNFGRYYGDPPRHPPRHRRSASAHAATTATSFSGYAATSSLAQSEGRGAGRATHPGAGVRSLDDHFTQPFSVGKPGRSSIAKW